MADIIEEVEDEVIEIPAREVAISQDRIETTLEKELTPVKEKIEVAEKPEEEALNDTPEKYRGKSAKEVIEMHQAAEKLIGKQGSEVGELRRVVDDFIQTQTSKESQTTETEVAPEDFYDNPAKNVKREIDNHPAIKEAKQAALEMKRSSTLTRLNAEYPELESTVQDPAFAEWIKGSKVRSELYNRAEVHFDYDAAKELLGNWSEKQDRIANVEKSSKIDKDNQLKAASIGSEGNNEPVSKKKYRRSDIIKLMQTDPDKYDALSDEIMAAYREGRVI
jgi:hypothetical protein|tara:strand:+ start:5949 stop:6782 length:834 start_codon:yes stop_codon:yes gene_type:complete